MRLKLPVIAVALATALPLVASIALVPIAGFLVTGTSAVLPAGGQVAAFLDQDVELAIRNLPSTPIDVDAARAPFEVDGTPEAAII